MAYIDFLHITAILQLVVNQCPELMCIAHSTFANSPATDCDTVHVTGGNLSANSWGLTSTDCSRSQREIVEGYKY